MILVYIENNDLLMYVVNMLDYLNKKYTTNLLDKYDSLLIAEINNKTTNLLKNAIENHKKVYFLTYLEEIKIDKYMNKNTKAANEYNKKLSFFIDNAYKTIVSLPYYKNIIKKSCVIPITFERPKIKSKKCVIIIDRDYSHLEDIYKLTTKYTNVNFIIEGYKSSYLLNKKDINYLNKFDNNTKFIRHDNIIKPKMVIYYGNNIFDIYKYLNMCSNILVEEQEKWDKYFINYKNMYLFKSENLDMLFNKIYNKKLCDLSYETYKLLNNIKFDTIASKFNIILK